MKLEDLVAPPPRPRFREELWEKAQARDREVARRWRAAAVVFAVVAIAAVSAAGVFALGSGTARTTDRTVSCPVPIQGGVPVFQLRAGAQARTYYSDAWHDVAGLMLITVGPQMAQLAGVTSAVGGYGLDSNICSTTAPIPLAPSGLPLEAVLTPKTSGLGSSMGGKSCLVGSRITIRLRTIFGSSGAPIAARLAVRTGKRPRPVVYLDWTPRRITAYVSSDCRDA